MAAGYNLSEGKYKRGTISEKDLQSSFERLFSKQSKKESTYKYCFLKSLLDNMGNINRRLELSFDQVFSRFAELYFPLIVKHKMPQKPFTSRGYSTLIEQLFREYIENNKIKENDTWDKLPTQIRKELVVETKRRCKTYVIGALYSDTDELLYSFSKKKEIIALNPVAYRFIQDHLEELQESNIHAWAKFYIESICPGEKSVTELVELFNKEFGNSKAKKIHKIAKVKKESSSDKKELQGDTVHKKVQKDSVRGEGKHPNRSQFLEHKIYDVLKKYPDLGLYLAQIMDQVYADKDAIKEILDGAYWCKKEGSRYFLSNMEVEDIMADALFETDEEQETEADGDEFVISDEKMALLDDPEQLIRKMKIEKGIIPSGKADEIPEVITELVSETQKTNKERAWDREEVLILVTEYFRTKSWSEKKLDRNYKYISDFLRQRERIRTGKNISDTFRNYAGIKMQTSRIRCLDPETKYNGMKGTKLQRQIVEEYLKHPTLIKREARAVFEKYGAE